MGGFVDSAFDAIGDIAGGIGKSVQGAFNGDIGSILNLGSIIPSPIQPFALGLNALQKASDDDPLGAAFSALGAGATGGLFSGLGDAGGITAGGNASANIGSNALGSLEGLAPSASSAGSTLGGVSSMFNPGSAMSAGLEGLSGNFGGVNPGISASAVPSMSNAIGSTGGLTGNFSPMSQGLSTASGGSDVNFLQQLFGTPGDFNSMYNSPGASILGAGTRALGGYMDYRNQRSMQNAYQDNIGQLQQLFSADSPYAQQMRQTLQRRDAARGRNSQYGAREQSLAANLTQNQANVLNSPQYVQQLGAANANLNPWAGILGQAPRLLSGIGGLF